MIAYIIFGIVDYLIGSFSSSVVLTKKLKGFDVREKGSGNAGSTNVLRTAGVKVAVLTLICDILKGVIAMLFALLISLFVKSIPQTYLVFIAAIFVVIGHTYPIFFGFKGGKGVATSLGILLFLSPKIGFICLIFAIALMALSRMVSLGSVSAAILFPILTIAMPDAFWIKGKGYLLFSLILAAIVIINHRTNIKRIITGTENRLSFKKKDGEEKKEETENKEKNESSENSESEEPKVEEPLEIKVEKSEENDNKEENTEDNK